MKFLQELSHRDSELKKLKVVNPVGSFKNEQLYDVVVQRMSHPDKRLMIYTKNHHGDCSYAVINEEEFDVHFMVY